MILLNLYAPPTLRDAVPALGDVVTIGKARVRCSVLLVRSEDVLTATPKGSRIAIPLTTTSFEIERALPFTRPAPKGGT